MTRAPDTERATPTHRAAFPLAAAIFLAVTGLGGCGGAARSDPHALRPLLQVVPVSPESAGRPESPARYLLKSGDRIDLRVLSDPTLNSIVEVQTDGRVAIPWVGTVHASGRPLETLESEIADSLSRLLLYPDVTLAIESFGPTRVYVTGEVAVEGAYAITAGQTVLGLVAAAGGLLTTANTQGTLLIRRSGEHEAVVYPVNLQRILEGADDFSDPIVQHLDIVHVPRTLIADIGIFVDQFFTRLRPAFTFYLEGWEAFHVDQVRVIRVDRTVR